MKFDILSRVCYELPEQGSFTFMSDTFRIDSEVCTTLGQYSLPIHNLTLVPVPEKE